DVLIDGAPAHSDTGGVINSAFKVFAGPQTITVKATDSTGAVSQSSINVVGEPANLPPTAALTITPLPSVSPTTVLACAAPSHDRDGFILKCQIQFSDGTTFTTQAAVHTFPAQGSFSVTTTVFDNFLATASTTQSFAVTSAATAASAEAQRAEAQSKPAQPQP